MSKSKTLEGRRSGTREARRILCRQVRKARKNLRGDRPTDSDIHSARKDIKNARATLRLLREALSGSEYSNENATLREAAHPLSAARDARILVLTLDRVLADHTAVRRVGGVRRLRRGLVHDSARARHQLTTETTGVRHARQLLDEAQGRAAHLHVGRHGWSRLGRGLTRVYRQGYASLDEVRSEPTVLRLHEWRKATKYLYHELKLLEPMCPRPLRRLAANLRRLSDDLGDDHDLAALRAQIASHPEIFRDRAGHVALLTAIERSRTKLHRRALLLGGRLFEDPPERFESRLHRYWLRWRRRQINAVGNGNHSC